MTISRCSLWACLTHSVLMFSRGTIDDCELVDGLVLTQRVVNSGLSRVEKAKIGLIQFCLSPPKTDVRTVTTSLLFFVFLCPCLCLSFFLFYSVLLSHLKVTKVFPSHVRTDG